MIYAVPPGANAVALSTAWKLDEFNWLQRGTVQDVMNFMSKVSAIEQEHIALQILCQTRLLAND